MSQSWPMVPLGEVLTQSEEWTKLEPDKEYQQVTVRMWGQGVTERDRVKGEAIKSEGRYVVRPGQFIMSRIDARNGAFGLVPDALDGGVVSNDFPSFEFDQEKMLPEFLAWLSKTRSFIEICTKASEGSTNRVRLKVDQFLKMPISLPPLSEQRRIVGRLEHLGSKIEEARGLQESAEIETRVLINQVKANFFDTKNWHEVPLGELLIEDSRNGLAPRPSDSLPGTPILRISAATSRDDNVVDEGDHKYLEVQESDLKKYALRHGDLLACRFNGNLHFVGKFAVYKGYSQETQVYPDKLIRFRVNTGMVTPEFACLALSRRKSREVIESFCATTAGNIGVSASNLKTILIPVPSLSEQQRLVNRVGDFQAQIDGLRQLQTQTRAELDALLPSILDKAFRGGL